MASAAMAKVACVGAEASGAPVSRLEVADNLDFMQSLAAGSMHLIVTSPPYNLGKAYEKRSSIDAYLDAQRGAIAAAVRVLAEGGSICWQTGNHVVGKTGEVVPLDALLYPLFKKHDLVLRNRIIWHFGHGLHCKKRFSGRHETVLWFTKGEGYHFDLDPVRVPSKYPGKKYFKGPRRGQLSGNPLGKNPGDVWDIPNVKANHVEKMDHPCQFPVELVERLVLALTRPGDNVLDPYAGVGSSIVAALMHGRNGYGCDTDAHYIDQARERVAAWRRGELRTRPMGRPIFDPRT